MNNTIRYREPELAIPIALIILPVFFSDTLFNAAILQYASIAFAFIALLICAFRQNWRLRLSVPITLWVAFIFLAIINKNQVFASGLGRSWFILFPTVLLSALVLSSAPGDKWKSTLQTIIIACAMVHAVATILSFIFPWLYSAVIRNVVFGSVARIMGEGYQAGLTTHYSMNGMYLATGLILAGVRWLNNQTKKNLAVTLLLLFALILTAKRAHSAFSVASILIVYLIIHRKQKLQSGFKIVTVFLAVILVLWLLSFVSDDIGLLFDRFSLMADDDTMNGRTDFYELCYTMFCESPLLGSGWGSYTISFNLTNLGAWYSSLGYTGMFAHNVFLQVLAEEGIIGEILFVGAIIASLYQTVSMLLKDDVSDAQAQYPATSLALQIFFTLYCITGNPLYDMQAYIPYMLLLSFFLSIRESTTGNTNLRVKEQPLGAAQ